LLGDGERKPDPPDPKTSSSTSSDIRRKTKDEQRALYRDEGDAMTGTFKDVDGRDVLTLGTIVEGAWLDNINYAGKLEMP